MGCSDSKPEKSLRGGPQLKIKQQQSPESKVVFLGDPGVGKSCIFLRFCENTFSDEHAVTLGGAYKQQSVKLKSGSSMKFHLWDTAGEERFRAMSPLYYRDANATVLVYEVSDLKSFQSLQYWINELDEKVRQDGLILVLAGNKCDLPENKRQVPNSMAKTFAENNKMIFFETSAKTGAGINNMFQTLAEELAKKSNNK